MKCRADLRVCLNCVSYDPRVAQQCRERRADPVLDKDVGNFCEYFDFIRRNWVPKAPGRCCRWRAGAPSRPCRG